MKKTIAVLLLLAALPAQADYRSEVANQEICERFGKVGLAVFGASKAERDEYIAKNDGKVEFMTDAAVAVAKQVNAGQLTTAKEAYMHAWAICMDERRR